MEIGEQIDEGQTAGFLYIIETAITVLSIPMGFS